MSKPFHGPRVASWYVTYSDSRGVSSYGALTNALADVAYFKAAGRDAQPTLVRTEHCPVPGCDGYGNVKVRGRGGRYRDVSCKAHVPAVECTEVLPSAL